eukprot:451955_1
MDHIEMLRESVSVRLVDDWVKLEDAYRGNTLTIGNQINIGFNLKFWFGIEEKCRPKYKCELKGSGRIQFGYRSFYDEQDNYYNPSRHEDLTVDDICDTNYNNEIKLSLKLKNNLWDRKHECCFTKSSGEHSFDLDYCTDYSGCEYPLLLATDCEYQWNALKMTECLYGGLYDEYINKPIRNILETELKEDFMEETDDYDVRINQGEIYNVNYDIEKEFYNWMLWLFTDDAVYEYE